MLDFVAAKKIARTDREQDRDQDRDQDQDGRPHQPAGCPVMTSNIRSSSLSSARTCLMVVLVGMYASNIVSIPTRCAAFTMVVPQMSTLRRHSIQSINRRWLSPHTDRRRDTTGAIHPRGRRQFSSASSLLSVKTDGVSSDVGLDSSFKQHPDDSNDQTDNGTETASMGSTPSSSSSSSSVPPSESGWRDIDWEAIHYDDTIFSIESLAVSKREDLRPTMCPQRPSPVEKVLVRNRVVYFKRDDLLRLQGSNVSGNKARKLFALNAIPVDDFPDCVVSYGGPQSNAMVALAAIVNSKNTNEAGRSTDDELSESMSGSSSSSSASLDELLDIVDDDPSTSYNSRYSADGGNDDGQGRGPAPGSGGKDTNQLSSISSSATKRKRFVYYTKRIPRYLRNNPSGNFFRAKSLGMEIIELTNDEYQGFFSTTTGGRQRAPVGIDPPVDGDSLWVPQGGACGVAVPGGNMLAKEIVLFWLLEGKGRPLSVCVPGGTCSTAVLLHKEIKRLIATDKLDLDIEVVVVPCVGNDAYARRQMMALNVETGGQSDEAELPYVLRSAPTNGGPRSPKPDEKRKYFLFGEPNVDILNTFQEMRDRNGILVDLLYGAPSWTIMLRHWNDRTETITNDGKDNTDEPKGEQTKSGDPLVGREIMYVHSGGLEGINSQMMRYRHKGMLRGNEVQEPSGRRRKPKGKDNKDKAKVNNPKTNDKSYKTTK